MKLNDKFSVPNERLISSLEYIMYELLSWLMGFHVVCLQELCDFYVVLGEVPLPSASCSIFRINVRFLLSFLGHSRVPGGGSNRSIEDMLNLTRKRGQGKEEDSIQESEESSSARKKLKI